MLMRMAMASIVMVFTMGTAAAQQCLSFPELCVAGMCQEGACVFVPLNSGSCDDSNACTTNDTCVEGECMGTPTEAGPACDDFNECTRDDVCTDFFGTITCMGTPVELDTRCESNCGLCQPLVPGFPDAGLVCKPDPERLNAPCTPGDDFGPCFVGRCTALGIPPAPQISFCTGDLRTCPDDGDGNLCTTQVCNPETGDCESSPLPPRQDCFPADCHRCEPSTGACSPINVGQSCDDFNECTGSTVCNAQGGCVAGSPQQTATPTQTTGGNTPTPTGTAGPGTPTSTVPLNTATPTRTQGPPPPTATPGRCVGDCDGNGEVRVNELVTGVNIVLESADLEDCPQFDVNSSGRVEVNELVGGVNSLTRGCVNAAALAP